jgi:hypothetical protein
VEAKLLGVVEDAILHRKYDLLEGLNSQDVQRLSSKRNLFEIALRFGLFDFGLEGVTRTLRAYGISPTDLAFQLALASFDEDTIKLIGDILISDYCSAAIDGIHGSLACAIQDQNLKDLVVLLKQDPSRANSPILETGKLPLVSAVLWQNYISAGMLVLLGADPVLVLPAGKSPVVIAVEKADLRMANILVGARRSSLGTGWEWHVAEALATIDFNAPGDLLDSLIKVMGIPLCLRLAIEHRHERLIGYMLWQFKTRSNAYLGTEAESDDVLEQALQAGISKDYVQYIKSDRQTRLTHVGGQSQIAGGGARRIGGVRVQMAADTEIRMGGSENVLELIDFQSADQGVN